MVGGNNVPCFFLDASVACGGFIDMGFINVVTVALLLEGVIFGGVIVRHQLTLAIHNGHSIVGLCTRTEFGKCSCR